MQAELKSKTEGSHVISHPPTASAHPQPSPVQRAVMNRHGQARRSMSGSSSKALRPQHITSHAPPRLQPTPPSHTNSPTAMKSPLSNGKGVSRTSSNGDPKVHQHQHSPLESRRPPPQGPTRLSIPTSGPTMQTMTPNNTDGSRSSEVGSAAGTQASFYPSPFQAHIEQLGKLSRPLLSLLYL